MLTIVIPAFNEETVISDCLQSLLAQDCAGPIEILISANGCVDNTVSIGQSFVARFASKGYEVRVLESSIGNKNQALNLADAQAQYPARLYLDADVICSPGLITEVVSELQAPVPVYVSGELSIPVGESFFSNAYGKIWRSLPYIRDAVTGIGCYAVNESGRKQWGAFPTIHSDDKFVRMLFASCQRVKTQATYEWPIPQGFFTLIKVRSRWIRGNREFRNRFPTLAVNDNSRTKLDRQSLIIMMRNPVATLIFMFVYGSAAMLASLKAIGTPVVWSRAR